MSDRIARMRDCLAAALSPSALEIIDESHMHVGHAGARDGRGHFALEIASAAFAGKTAIARHRMIYIALGDMMQTDIHALSIKARAPSER